MYIDEVERYLQSINVDVITNNFKEKWQELLELIPEFKICTDLQQDNPHHIYTVDKHILMSVAYIHEKNLELRLIMLFHDIGKGVTKTIDEHGIGHFYKHPLKSKEISEEILVRIGYPSQEIREVRYYIERHDMTITRKTIRKLYNDIGYEGINKLLKIKEADSKAQNPKYQVEKITRIKELREYLEIYRMELSNWQLHFFKRELQNHKD